MCCGWLQSSPCSKSKGRLYKLFEDATKKSHAGMLYVELAGAWQVAIAKSVSSLTHGSSTGARQDCSNIPRRHRPYATCSECRKSRGRSSVSRSYGTHPLSVPFAEQPLHQLASTSKTANQVRINPSSHNKTTRKSPSQTCVSSPKQQNNKRNGARPNKTPTHDLPLIQRHLPLYHSQKHAKRINHCSAKIH